MNLNLTTKERYLLEDQKNHEEICIQKYTNYANLASDGQLKDLFTNHATIEKEHLDTVNQLLNGQVPNINTIHKGTTNPHQTGTNTTTSPNTGTTQMKSTNTTFQTTDKDLCTDMLNTEKYVSSAYDTTIFEFRDTEARDVLNHLQLDEQKHGEALFKYMDSHGMYTTK